MNMKTRFKFRIWDTLEKQFIMPDSLGGKQHYFIHIDGTPINMQNGDGGSVYILQQWTGLTDKNDIDIYEGDIVNAWDRGVNANLEIKWGDRTSGFFMHRHTGGLVWHLSGDSNKKETVKVIGNIFENYDLVK